jgi:stage III sporulation protein AG
MEEQRNIIKAITNKFKNSKNMEIIVAILIIAVIASIYVSSFSKSSQPEENHEDEAKKGVQWVEGDTYEDQQEAKLQKKLSAIKGAGAVEVMITYKSSKEIITAMNTVQSQTTTEEQDSNGGIRKVSQEDVNNQAVTMNESGGAKPLVLKEMEPEIKGVIVIAEGAKDVLVKIDLMRAVQVALGVSAQQVEVFEMESNKEEE